MHGPCTRSIENLDHMDGGAVAAHEDVDHVPVGQHRRRRSCFSSAAPVGNRRHLGDWVHPGAPLGEGRAELGDVDEDVLVCS